MIAIDPRAIEHYKRWGINRFPSERIYILVITAVTSISFITWWLVGRETGEKFDWTTWLKLSALFSLFGSVFVFVVRWAAVSASWIVAKQALDLIRIGEGGKAWMLLSARYRGIHPLVINEPAFREILAAAAKASDDPAVHEIVTESAQDSHLQRERLHASEHIESKAKKAAIFILTCFVLMVLVGVIRILLR